MGNRQPLNLSEKELLYRRKTRGCQPCRSSERIRLCYRNSPKSMAGASARPEEAETWSARSGDIEYVSA